MGAFDDYLSLMVKSTSKILLPVLETRRDELNAVMGNHLFGTTGPTTIERKLSMEEDFFGKLFRGFTEIHKSFEALQDIEVYVSRFPLSKSSITKERYLRFHVEAYLHEIYILRERLLSYLKVLQKQYRKTKYEKDIKKRSEKLTKLINGALSDIIDTRGSHVHQSRFSDMHMDRLSSLDLLSRTSDEPAFKRLYRSAFIAAKKHWLTTIERNRESITKLLEIYFSTVIDIVQDKIGDLRYPEKLGIQSRIP